MSQLLVFTVLLLFVLLACNQCEAAVAADEVTSLPGWDKPLPSKQYSGYIEIQGTGKRMHYWFARKSTPHTTLVYTRNTLQHAVGLWKAFGILPMTR